MEITIEKLLCVDNYEHRNIYGSCLCHADVSRSLISKIKAGEYINYKTFEKETSISQDKVASVKIGDRWYKANYFMDNLYVENFTPTDGRVYWFPAGDDLKAYKEAKDSGRDVGPYGGAFSSDTAYITWRTR